VISTSNQKALVWNLGMKSWQDSVEFVLHGHTRAITDINFSAQHPDVLATCAVDSFVHCWDLRVPARPVISFSDWFAGATQVKWSRQVSHVIASSHDKYLRIWDDRMGAYPVRSIEAHDTKIYGIDWNRHEQSRIVTCSLDKSIKFWDCNNLEDIPERTINTPFPAWRARHTPFGWGLLAMPQRGNSDLHLYDHRSTSGRCKSGAVPAVARFDGHKGQVKEFLWRPRGTIIDSVDHREFQLVTWGTDQELQLHRMVPETLSAVGYEKGVNQSSGVNFTRSGAKYKTFRDEPSEELFDEVFYSQTGSSPAAGQSFHSRARASTSVGMSKVAIPHPQGWLQGSSVTARIGMHGKTGARQIMNPIDWMKNVKITSWKLETLGEEIAQVGERFTKVAFETVDVSQRKAVISMHAPWGNFNASIFMKLDMKFPVAYPREAAAIFNIQKTTAMTDELAGVLSTELRTIAETYVARKRGCLEAALRYLLREQDVEQIVSWILDESLENSKIADDIGFEEEISSDEDDVGGTTFQGPSGIINSSELLNANRLVPVPKGCGAMWADNGKLVCFFPPKPKQPSSFLDTLGTRTSDSDKTDNIFEGFGRLKTDLPGARTTLRTVTSGDDQTSELSDDSSFSSLSSSGSSDNLASLPTHFFPRTAWRPGGVSLERSKSADHSSQSAIGLSKAKFGGESSDYVISIHDFSELVPSKRGLAMKYLVFGRGSDMCGYNADMAMSQGYEDIGHIWRLMRLILRDEIPLENISNILGSADVLAIARSASDVVKGHDSGVDLSYDGVVKRSKVVTTGRLRWGGSALGGKYLVPALINYFENLGDIQMLAMLSCVFAEPRALNSSVPLSQQHQQHHHLSMQLKAPAFSVDYHPSVEVARSITNTTCTTSFASTNMIVNLPDRDHLTSMEKAIYSNPTTPYSTGTTPPNLAQHLSQQPADRRRSSRLSSTDVRDHSHSDSASAAHSGPISLSSSPDDTRSTHRTSSNLAFSISRASRYALAPAFSQSPPAVSSGSAGHKKSSPVGSLLGHHVSAGGWSTASIFGGPGSGRGKPDIGAQKPRPGRRLTHLAPSSSVVGHSHSTSSDGDAIEHFRRGSSSIPTSKAHGNVRPPSQSTIRKGTRRKIRIKSALHNQNMFDEDGYASVALLDPSFEWKYRAYRASYAHLLGVWGLYSQRAEVLKFDGLLGYFEPTPKGVAVDRSMDEYELALGNLLRRKALDVTKTNFAQKRGLEIRRRCNQCGRMLVAIEKNGIPIAWHCTTCLRAETRSSTRMICAICTKSIAGIMVPCLNCGHATCFECHREWLARDNNINTTDDNTLDFLEATDKPCPTGCDCICSAHQFATVRYPTPSEDEDQAEEEQGQEDDASQPAAPPPTAADLLSTHGPDTAIGAFLSLSRGRSASSSKPASDRGGKGAGKSSTTTAEGQSSHSSKEDTTSVSGDAYTDAWAKYANMGKGLGAGLTRSTVPTTKTLKERGSDATIRRDSEAEARLRRAGSMYE
jgi:WD repeat-containing protein 59